MKDINRYIDHTLLRVDAKQEDIEKLCQEARDYNFKTVCVNPFWVPLAHKLLKGSSTEVATVVGFPLGATSTYIKAEEAQNALCDGATEIDMVMNVGAFLSEDYQAVERDIKIVRDVVKDFSNFTLIKVILEVRCLTEKQIREATEICASVGVDFVKTCTGFGPNGGATVNDIQIIKEHIKEGMEIKASGGIRDYQTAVKMIEAGATRIGTSSGVAIMKELHNQLA